MTLEAIIELAKSKGYDDMADAPELRKRLNTIKKRSVSETVSKFYIETDKNHKISDDSAIMHAKVSEVTRLSDILNDDPSFVERLLNSDEEGILHGDPPTSIECDTDDDPLEYLIK